MDQDQKNSLAEAWSTIRKTRLDWAYRGHNQFLSTLDENVQNSFGSNSGEVTVVLFGKTQVGKTTLLLQLLNVADEHFEKISTLLRGKQTSGKSATATAMQYLRSSGDKWQLTINNKSKDLSEEELLEELFDIRQKVESNQLQINDPICLSIPGCYFNKNDLKRPQVRILDLPGDNPKNENERKHVIQIAERYVPNADLILLVGKADDLAFINPNAFTIPGIQDWRYTPRRFRIITTYSFSLKSLRDWVLNETTQKNVGTFRQRLLDQISTHNVELSNEAKNLNLYYPLEFGDSWASEQKKCSPLYKAMEPVISELMKALLEDIKKSATPHGRILQAKNAHIVANTIKINEIEKIKNKIIAEEEKCKNINNDSKTNLYVISKNEEILNNLKTKFKNENNIKEQLNNKSNDIILLDVFEASYFIPKKDKTNTKYFKQKINDLLNHLKEQVINSRLDNNIVHIKSPFVSDNGKIESIVNECFSALRKKLNDYALDEYYPSFSDDFENDRTSMRSAVDHADQQVTAYLINQWKEQVDSVNKKTQAEISLQERKLNDFNILDQQFKQKIMRFDNIIKAMHVAKDEFIARMDKDIEQGKKFSSFLEDSYLKELQTRKSKIANASTQAARWLELLGALEVTYEKEKLFSAT